MCVVHVHMLFVRFLSDVFLLLVFVIDCTCMFNHYRLVFFDVVLSIIA